MASSMNTLSYDRQQLEKSFDPIEVVPNQAKIDKRWQYYLERRKV
jgi:hypothetical protein